MKNYNRDLLLLYKEEEYNDDLIQNEVEDKLSDGILSGKFTLGSVVRITTDKEGNLTLVNDDESYSDEGEIIVAPTGTPTI